MKVRHFRFHGRLTLLRCNPISGKTDWGFSSCQSTEFRLLFAIYYELCYLCKCGVAIEVALVAAGESRPWRAERSLVGRSGCQTERIYQRGRHESKTYGHCRCGRADGLPNWLINNLANEMSELGALVEDAAPLRACRSNPSWMAISYVGQAEWHPQCTPLIGF